MKGFYREKFPGLFNGENPKQLKNVYKLLEYYDCTLDELIILMEKYFNSNRNDVISNTADGLKWDMFKLVTGEESDDFGDYKIMKCFLCSKAVRLLLSFDWIDRYILDMDNKSDIGKIQSLITYWEKNKYSNGIQNYIDCRKNIEDTRQERISLTKGIIDRYGRICDVIDMREALAGILGGVETIFVPSCICEMYIPFIMEKESEILFQEKIKDMLEKKYGRRLSYFQVGAPFKTMRNVSDLYMRNCYYYIAEDNQPVEIYVENISASLSAMVRVVTLVCELLGVSLEKRNCTVICMVDSIRDMQLFIKLLEWANKRYNATTQLRIPVYFVLYDEIKKGKLLSYDSEHTR